MQRYLGHRGLLARLLGLCLVRDARVNAAVKGGVELLLPLVEGLGDGGGDDLAVVVADGLDGAALTGLGRFELGGHRRLELLHLELLGLESLVLGLLRSLGLGLLGEHLVELLLGRGLFVVEPLLLQLVPVILRLDALLVRLGEGHVGLVARLLRLCALLINLDAKQGRPEGRAQCL